MAREDIFIRLQVDTSDGVSKTAALAREIDAATKELKAFKLETKEQTVLTGQQATKLSELETRLHGLRGAYREAKNDTSGLTDANLRFRDKIGETFNGKLNASIASFGSSIVAAFAVDKLISFGDEMRKRGIEIEQITNRAKVLFGEGFGPLSDAATKNGEAIGKSRVEFIQMASAAQDVFTNLGFAKKATADMSSQLALAAGDIEDFTAGQVSAEQATEILKNAVLGNTKGLKELNIPVKQNAEDIAALATEIQQSEGVTKDQAEAMARLQFTMEALNPKIEEFKGLQGDADAAADKATAKLKNQSDALAASLAPAFTVATNALSLYLENINQAINSSDGFIDKALKIGVAISGQAGISAALSAQDTIDQKVGEVISKLGDNADLGGLKALAIRVKGLLTEALAAEDEVAVERYTKKINEINDAIRKVIGETKPAVIPVDLDIQEDQVLTVGELRKELSALKEAREELAATDAEGLAKSNAEIASLEAQIAKIDGKTSATKQLTEAQREKLALEQEMAALAAQPITPLDTNAPAGTGGLALATPSGTALNEGADPAAILAQEDSLQSQLAALRIQYREDDIATFGEYLIRKNELETQAANKSIAEEERVQQIRQQVAQQALGQAASLFNSLANMAEENSEEQKALATVAALINTYQGATAALAAPDVLPQPFALVLKLLSVAAVIASGLSSVKKIQGFAQGGVVRQSDGAPVRRSNGDTVLVTAKPGEMYLTEGQQERVKQIGGRDIFGRAGVPGSVAGGFASLKGAMAKVRQHLGPVQTGIPGFAGGGVVPSLAGAQLAQINVTNAIAGINFSPRVLVDDVDRGLSDKAEVTSLSTL